MGWNFDRYAGIINMMKERSSNAQCPFCGAEVERVSFAESSNFRAVYNIAPILPGHSLVVPKRHVTSLMALSDAEAAELMLFGRDVVALLIKVFQTDGFNWTIQEGEQAGQSVPHLHMHLIPRTAGDLPSPGDWYPRLQESAKATGARDEAIDSESRPRLKRNEVGEIVTRIRLVAQKEGVSQWGGTVRVIRQKNSTGI